jgi:nucleotide-binding universal stress UspA family protein
MSPFQSALVALSVSDSDVGLLRYAALLARQGICRQFQFVHVAAARQGAVEPFEPRETVDGMQESVRQYFDAAGNYPCRALEGARLDQILRAALEQQADLIVLGYRRQRSGRRSLARRLAMVSPCSIWMVPEGAPDRIDRILVPVDFSAPSADAISRGTALARQCGLAECLALHVYFDPSTVRYDEHVEETRGEEQAAFQRFVAPIDCHGIEVRPILEENSQTAPTILRNASQHGANLIVMGTRGRSFAAAVLLGSVTSQTMVRTHVPLLALKNYGTHMSLIDALTSQRLWDRPVPKTG